MMAATSGKEEAILVLELVLRSCTFGDQFISTLIIVSY